MRRWKSTAREATASLVAFLPVFVIVGNELGWNDVPRLSAMLAAAAALSTAFMSPAGKKWVQEYLGTDEYVGKRRKDD